MNVVYALSGEGRGHASLARAVLPVLEEAGHRLKVVTYGRSVDRLREYDLIEIRGIRHFYTRDGRLSVPRSFVGNAGIFPYYFSHWNSLRRQLRAFAPDLFIVNFEPFTPLLARSLGVPVIAFDNQHALLFLDEPVPPGLLVSALVTKTAARLVAAGADAYVVMSFHSAGRCGPRVHVVPPVVQNDYRDLKPTTGGHTLVYLKEHNPRLLELLRGLDERFVVYGEDRDAVEGNLTFRSFRRDMPEEMASAKAVMGTSGLALISEALWLKKPFFGIPLQGEFEQMTNALFVRESGFGDCSERPSPADFGRFYRRLPEYRGALAGFQFDTDAAAQTLLELAESILEGEPAPEPAHPPLIRTAPDARAESR